MPVSPTPFVPDSSLFPSRKPSSAHLKIPPTLRLGAGGEPLTEFGPLLPFVSDPSVTDVFVNGAGQLWVDRGATLSREPSPWGSEQALRNFATRLVSSGGRHLDETNPCVDVRLHNGIRVHAVLPPISTIGTLLSVRLPSVHTLSLTDLAFDGFFSIVGLEVVRELVYSRTNILISGAGGSGKTTLLAALLSSAASGDRIVAIEDVAELQVEHEHFIGLESRQANIEAAGGVGLDRLVREALRMRPDRLVVGECRGAEIRELLAALNTGHDGGAGTVHANSLDDVPARLEALGALANLSPTALARQAVSAIGAILHIDRVHGRRRLTQLGRFTLGPSGRLQVEPLKTRVSAAISVARAASETVAEGE
jgi:pilus assembly protein CpaF